jgi:hypothetical protein
MVEIWLATQFEGGRHARRLAKISEYEQNQCTAVEASVSPGEPIAGTVNGVPTTGVAGRH